MLTGEKDTFAAVRKGSLTMWMLVGEQVVKKRV